MFFNNQNAEIVYCHSENCATSRICKVLPNMFFFLIWWEKIAAFRACTCYPARQRFLGLSSRYLSSLTEKKEQGTSVSQGMHMQVILDSLFSRPGSAPIGGKKKGEFSDWTTCLLTKCKFVKPAKAMAAFSSSLSIWRTSKTPCSP